ncbi:thioredoxin-disulfide reductase [Aureimonas pseudogalii]|uniref:Thioredoxin reductase n=1 Tax=Aureimonas pseudogalii TaxID=1744844 RepID=A0A7W6H2Q6_9HYPH|nr:thioredoxin-disulfide reductase [Aureimonas pseudogalii]MBB3996332.1 thioredoxin reductase (NADPH) [Aureimonas pseudogalii]
MTQRHAEILVIGSGPAGYTAAIYAARAMMKPLLVAGLQEGGQLTITSDVENYPGYRDPIGGPFLMEEMKQQALNVGAEMASDLIVEADLSRRPFRFVGDSGTVYTADAVIVATGAQARWLGLESEAAFQGFGVSACATCDGFFYRGKDVVVVGGGNTAVEEALYLSNIAKSVTVVHRRSEFRAERIMQNRLFARHNVRVIWNAEVAEITGTTKPMKSVTGVRLRDRTSGEITEHATHGVFVAIGHAPATEVFGDQLRQKDGGYLWVEPGTTKTSVEGVFAAGDVADDVYRQAVTAAGLGCMAALEAERWLTAMAVQTDQQQQAAE